MRLGGYLDTLCWSQADLSRRSKVSVQSVSRALAGERVTRRVANQIVTSLGEELGRKLALSDIEGLHVVSLKRRKRAEKPTTQESVKPVRERKSEKNM